MPTAPVSERWHIWADDNSAEIIAETPEEVERNRLA